MFDLTPLNSLLLAGFGFCVGMAGSVMGVGGGVFIIPLLVLALKIPIHQAVAVSLAAVAASSSAVASVNVERGLANMRLGVVLETTTALGSVAGALLAGRLRADVIQFLFALVLVPVSFGMYLKGRRGRGLARAAGEPGSPTPAGAFDAVFFDPSTESDTAYRVKNVAPASFISLFAGALAGLVGLAGGVVQVPVMNLMCGVPIKAAAATSNFLIGVSAAAGALIYFRNGYLIPELAAVTVVGVLLGSFAGIHILYKVASEKIQTAFAAITFLAALKMFKLF